MALASQLLSRDPKLQACLVSDLAHIVEGAAGEHVSKTQTALQVLGLAIDGRELRAKRYGPSTASAVLNFKMLRNIINGSYQTKPDNAAQHRVLLHSRIPCAKIRRPKTGGNAMNAVKTAVCLLLPVLAMAPADVCAQSDVTFRIASFGKMSRFPAKVPPPGICGILAPKQQENCRRNRMPSRLLPASNRRLSDCRGGTTCR